MKRFFVILLAVILILAIFIVSMVTRSFPKTSGRIILSGLNGPVIVYFDQYNIPQIYANSRHDLFFAQGYMHAQERFWQMDFWRHIGAGRLSEMFGHNEVRTDSFIRTMGWPQVADDQLRHMDPESQQALADYSAGINAYLEDHHGTQLSLEYGFLRLLNSHYQVEPWKPQHSITWGLAMSWDLSENLSQEIARASLLDQLTPEQIDQLYPPYPVGFPIIVSPGQDESRVFLAQSKHPPLPKSAAKAMTATLENLSALDSLFGSSGEHSIGSNNWAISGSRTATGKPILCNDPHLGIQLPSIWYEVGLHCNQIKPDCGFDVTGFSFPGVPGIIIGHNRRIAWGFTNVGPDVQDLYIEKVNPANSQQYEVNGQWVDMKARHETIQVSDGPPVDLTVRMTRHGPIISDRYRDLESVHKSIGTEFPKPYAIAFRWTALESAGTFPALWKINLAQNWAGFRAAASQFDVPSQNMIYADVDGNIGYQCPGKIPIRASGDGRYPVPGWTDAYEWTGTIPFNELPNSFNPEKGYIVTANNKVAADTYPYMLSHDWDYGFRARRIEELIAGAKHPLALEEAAAIQGDNRNPNAETLVPVLMQIPISDAHLQQVRNVLNGWDLQDDMDSSAAALFEVFWKHLLAETFHDKLPKDRWPGGGSRMFYVTSVLAQQPDNWWWDNKKTQEKETRDQIFAKAFAGAVQELEATLGKDPAKWSWGRLHTTTFRNQTLGQSGIGIIEWIFNRGPFPASGGGSLVNATSWNASADSYEVTDLPSMRMAVDLGDLSRSIAVLTTGESGHAFNPHYTDMADMWRNIQYHPMAWGAEKIRKSAKSYLILSP
ncbi:MAG TPA: penicillin acylase family protein [Acidobacteriota bacterium]|nr:penicillin acylase family protein [Acidobacteriota bacterium]